MSELVMNSDLQSVRARLQTASLLSFTFLHKAGDSVEAVQDT